MDKRLKYINGLLLDWGLWCREGQACQGVFSTSQWATGKPLDGHKTLRQRNTLVPMANPKETRTTTSKLPVIRIDYKSEKIHSIVLSLPDSAKPILCCLYIRGMSFGDISLSLGVTSKIIGKVRPVSYTHLTLPTTPYV